MINKMISAALVLALATPLLIAGGCASGSSDIAVKVAEAEAKAVETSVEISGVLIPVESVNVSSKISGKVSSADFEVGESVEKGQLLVQLDTTEANAQLASAQAAYNNVLDQAKQAKIPMDSAAADLARTQALFDEGAVSRQALDQSQASYDSAKAKYDAAGTSSLAQARAAVDSAAAQMANAKITSPTDGVVVTKNIHAGEMVSPGATLVAVSDISFLKLKGTVSQELFPFLQKGQKVELVLDAFQGTVFAGEISLLGPVSVGTGSYFPIELTIENTGEITAGLSAHSAIQVRGRPGVVAPAAAVVKDGAETFVFVVDGSTVRKRVVATGLGNSEEIEITEGLMAGEAVAVTNVNVLADGMAVKTVE
ncbi:MAG: efflux RND transporter periplasmic adaptor subunit [Clostridiales bacterium]|nr:efflux RND transporter periplasmic adaptor subunit [Clostridiales bacterium]